jgi:hypothetical protein
MRKLVGCVVVLLTIITIFAVPAYLNNQKVRDEFNHSACQVLNADDLREILKYSPKIKAKADEDESAFDGPLTNCSYYVGSGVPKLSITIWCGKEAIAARHRWLHSGYGIFWVNGSFGVVKYRGDAKISKIVTAAAEQGQEAKQVCPTK